MPHSSQRPPLVPAVSIKGRGLWREEGERTVVPVVAVDDVLSGAQPVVHVHLAARIGPVDGRAGADEEGSLVRLRATHRGVSIRSAVPVLHDIRTWTWPCSLRVKCQRTRRRWLRGRQHTVGVRAAAAAVAVRGARGATQIVVLLHERYPQPTVVAACRACASLGRAPMHSVRLAIDVLGANQLRCALDANWRGNLAQLG